MADLADKNEPSRPLYHQSNDPYGEAPYAEAGSALPDPCTLARQEVRSEAPER